MKLAVQKIIVKICQKTASNFTLLTYIFLGSSTLYYHCNEETEDEVWTEADQGGFSDRMNTWIRKWEEHSYFTEEIPTRHIIVRNGNVLHATDGILR